MQFTLFVVHAYGDTEIGMLMQMQQTRQQWRTTVDDASDTIQAKKYIQFNELHFSIFRNSFGNCCCLFMLSVHKCDGASSKLNLIASVSGFWEKWDVKPIWIWEIFYSICVIRTVQLRINLMWANANAR